MQKLNKAKEAYERSRIAVTVFVSEDVLEESFTYYMTQRFTNPTRFRFGTGIGLSKGAPAPSGSGPVDTH